jgi:uncharacterized protein (DUF1499 family)
VIGKTLAQIALGAVTLGVLLLALAGPGVRFGAWGYKAGFGVLSLGVGALLVGVGGSLASLMAGGSRGLATLTLGLALGAAVVPVSLLVRARRVPVIHDITTDTEDPPAFVAVLARRAPGDNPPAHGGAEVAAAQRRAYPDLSRLDLDEAPAAALARAREAARGLGWEIVAEDPASGRLEATDTTFWFGFKDDVVVRIRPRGTGSRLDVRSASRVGKSDVGANAARIRRFLRRVAAR